MNAVASDGIAVEPVRIQAEDYTSDNGNGLKKETSSDATGMSLGNVGGSWDGGEIVFDKVSLGATPLSSLTVRYVNNSGRVGQNPSLEFYLDDKSEANKLTTVALPVTGSNWNAYNTTTVELPREVSGDHKLIVVMRVTADSGHPYVGNFDYFEFAPEALPETYLTTDDEWKYSDNATDPSGNGSLSWTTAEFDDSAWKQAAGSFGSKKGAADLGGGFVADTLLQYLKPGSADTVETYHFRTDVDISAGELAQLDSLQGSITYDDAVRVYVNGVKVAGFEDERVNGAANQNLTYAGNSNGDPRTSSFTVPADLLEAGENTVSVALYQDRATSSDIYLDVTALSPVANAPEVPEGPVVAKITDVALGVGETEAERNLAWYSDVDVAQVAQLAPASAVVDGAFPESATTVEAVKTGGTSSGEFFRDAVFADLSENTQYAYRVGSEETGWSDIYTFRTQDFSGDFSFLFFGDPQLGASGNLQRDGAGWLDTLNVATESYPDAELLFSAGDQVESAANESQYESLFAPEQMQSIPFVATNGNHDVGSKAYEQHFNVPNEDLTAGAGSSTSSGGDYWFIYKDVLFVNLNSNSRDYASHNAFMDKVIAEQGDKASWRVLAFHHSIYSVAAHSNDGDILDRRGTMPQKISELDFDVVLMGHDHNYTRSYLIKDGQMADAQELAGQSSVEAKDGEVLYVTANSASGSKYYNTTVPDAWFASVMNQEKVRNYSVLEVTDEDITMRTLRSESNGSSKPVNSVVDEVVLTRDAAPELSVPADSEIAFGDTFDALEGVTAIDNVDGDLTTKITVTGTVDTATAGTYSLTYAVKDARGNESTVTRVVTVMPKAEEPGTEEPGTEEPGTEEPGTEEPGTEEPGTEEPGTEEPGTEEPSAGKPGFTPGAPVADGADLPFALKDKVEATINGRTVTLSGLVGDSWHYVYAYSAPTGLGWVQSAASGTATVTLPASLEAGTHRIAVTDAEGALVGWAEVTIAAPAGSGLAVTGSDAAAAWGFGTLGALMLAAGGVLLIARRRVTATR
ncbi:hypothetical protein FHX48_002282 [Microbacterium halimionae]|uniref:CBM6 domain-containing protein n=1 Tax=Microbacterium halimionae TaxID=1526413 RepID=A0A7W3PMR1_9MICO|nr:immunoglobulin-like domain-containing protein [Microbacterium halimionae]MBA8817184.1 hypothetical protein [Microbacterium halimionae]NII94634.1 hypothetical protein [Microbacterium halimionae]